MQASIKVFSPGQPPYKQENVEKHISQKGTN
jgi:hypothetical protein